MSHSANGGKSSSNRGIYKITVALFQNTVFMKSGQAIPFYSTKPGSTHIFPWDHFCARQLQLETDIRLRGMTSGLAMSMFCFEVAHIAFSVFVSRKCICYLSELRIKNEIRYFAAVIPPPLVPPVVTGGTNGGTFGYRNSEYNIGSDTKWVIPNDFFGIFEFHAPTIFKIYVR